MNAGPLKVYISEQMFSGERAVVWETPIDDFRNRTQTNLTKTILRSYIRKIIRKSCQGNVSEVYAEQAFGDNTIVILMFQGSERMTNTRSMRSKPSTQVPTEDVNPIGFILARQEDDGNGWYIDVICSIRNTAELLKYFIQYCEGEPISLSAIPSVLAYYPKFNFKFRTSCDEPELVKLPESLQKRNPRERPFPKRTEDAYNDDEFSDLMLKLVEHGLAVKKDNNCDKGKLTKDELKSGDCGEQGFTMIRCGENTQGGSKNRQNRQRRQTRKTRQAMRKNRTRSR